MHRLNRAAAQDAEGVDDRGDRQCFWLSTPGRAALTCSEELQSIRTNTCSRAAKNPCHPPLAPL
jgi:hypothetical protein